MIDDGSGGMVIVATSSMLCQAAVADVNRFAARIASSYPNTPAPAITARAAVEVRE